MNLRKSIAPLALTLAVGVASTSTWAEVAVIVHPDNGADISAKDIERIFLGKSKSFSGGGEALPINQTDSSPVRESFDTGLLDKTPAQMKAYWSKLVFTGKGTPPKEVSGDDEVKALISSNPNTIGYVDAGSVDGSVKVIHKF